jgi:hypothetical protein
MADRLSSKIVVYEKPTVVVALQPVMQMNLIQIGSHETTPTQTPNEGESNSERIRAAPDH